MEFMRCTVGKHGHGSESDRQLKFPQEWERLISNLPLLMDTVQ